MKKRGSSCRGMLGSKPAWRGPRWQSCWCWSLAALWTPRDALSEKKKGKSSFPAASRPNYPKIPKFQQHSKGSTTNYPKIPKFQRHSKGRQPKSHLKPVFYPKRQPQVTIPAASQNLGVLSKFPNLFQEDSGSHHNSCWFPWSFPKNSLQSGLDPLLWSSDWKCQGKLGFPASPGWKPHGNHLDIICI